MAAATEKPLKGSLNPYKRCEKKRPEKSGLFSFLATDTPAPAIFTVCCCKIKTGCRESALRHCQGNFSNGASADKNAESVFSNCISMLCCTLMSLVICS